MFTLDWRLCGFPSLSGQGQWRALVDKVLNSKVGKTMDLFTI
jgi:hypothetical protein